MPRPTPKQVQDARDRYRQHLKAVSGEQTMDAFAASPYIRLPGRGQAWYWHEEMMRTDCSILAENDVLNHPE